MKITVIGAGYVGLVQAVGMARLGHDVTCVEIQDERRERLAKGEVPFFEPGLKEMLNKSLEKNQLRFTDRVPSGVLDLIFIAVQTPQSETGAADLSYLQSACEMIGRDVQGDSIVVLKSTIPPGVRARIHEWLANDKLEVASNPEFLREGKAVEDFFAPSRIVFGVESKQAEEKLREAYTGVEAPVFVMSVESAQLAKYASNTMLAMRLSLMNEIANIADVVGADIRDVSAVVGSDPRIGSSFLRAGAGFGGSCFPKDVLALEAVGKEGGFDSRLIAPIIEVNKKQAEIFVQKIQDVLGELSRKTIAVWGLAFNAETDDVRESPAIRVIRLLLEQGVSIKAYDPQAIESAREVLGAEIEYASSKIDCLQGADALAVLTEWEEFIDAPWDEVKEALNSPMVFDGKNVLNTDRITEAGMTHYGIGLCNEDSQLLPSFS